MLVIEVCTTVLIAQKAVLDCKIVNKMQQYFHDYFL